MSVRLHKVILQCLSGCTKSLFNVCPAAQAAGTIHTDFERGFICAEVMHFEELKELGTESAVKAAGKYRSASDSPPINPFCECQGSACVPVCI
jgi:hypothetical protein